MYKIAKNGQLAFGTTEQLLTKIQELSKLLLSLKSAGYKNSCWGYNFDWQARRLFLFPSFTPTVVATCFCASALFEAFEITGDGSLLEEAVSACKFVAEDLKRTDFKEGIIFSYSPLEGNNTVYNASLLGAKLLSIGFKYTKNQEFKVLAELAVKGAISGQNEDGSWVYGLLPVQNWIDSFHTGYNLEALYFYQQCTGDYVFKDRIEKALNYYYENFFLNNGTPKYYHDETYPIDIHCPAQLLLVLKYFDTKYDKDYVAQKVLGWTFKNMQDRNGYFYYQLKKGFSSKISYMRWSNAFMFYAMSNYMHHLTSK
ncbi:delta-aminolevulinic acid dehydratase [Aquiflexum sp. LQ15W]|uniref:delta-aminolevulinic acid dehydratase n=1 Tax=Cognataquiflexum nitidum TaxID=2922272 RepID=UPI001F12F321|nr:delta-aminolevulinic acid dehydratase [Cognataquiflexum nitidum]MCH6198335.1 delta-aminolevulinic acid dehydratase [Cognataquiflexum nitidum]